jgi:serine/threonine-protein kinase
MAGQKPKSERNKPLQLDDAAFDALTALIAVRDGLATEAQVESALAEKKKLAAASSAKGEGADAPKPKRLAYLLVDEGVLDEAKAKDLEKRLDPEVLPGYRILGEAGRGGMGTVFKARQLSMDRVVALKILANRLSKDARYVEKFLHEARAAGKLNHEHIVSAIDCGAASGFHYFVMEFVDGKTAMEVLAAEGPLPWERVFEYGEHVARALEHAHANGLVHRDVKPENIMVSQTVTGLRVKLCDLGLAKEAVPAGTGEKSKMTEGTPSYASPEQALGRTDIDARSDLYSLGATLYHLLSGEPPFDGENARTILWKQVHKPFPDLDAKLPNVPAPLRELLGKMVEKEREKRLASARAFMDELAAIRKKLAGPPSGIIAAAPSRPAAGGTKLLGAAVATLVALAVPAAILASKSGSDKGGDVAAVATRTDDKPRDPPQSSGDENRKPLLVRIGDTPADTPPAVTPSKDGPGDGSSSGSSFNGDEVARAAQLLLDRANQFHDQNPDDLQGYATKLRSVVDRYPGTPAAVVAASDLSALNTEGQAAVMKDLEKAGKDAQALADKGKFKDAVAVFDALSEKWDARVLAPLKPAIERARQIIVGAVRDRIAALAKEGDAHLLKGEPIDDTVAALLALEADSPAPVSKEAHAKADDLKSRLALALADAALKDALQRRDEALSQGKLTDGEQVAQDASKDPKIAPRPKELAAFVAETADIARIWRGFDDRIRALQTQAKHNFKRKNGPPVEGQLKDYDAVAWSFRAKPFGLRELVSIDVRDLPLDDLLDLVLPSREIPDLRAGALFLAARHEAEVATQCLDRAVAAGMPDDPVLRARIAALEGQEHDVRAARLVEKALAAGAVNNAPEDVIAAVRLLSTGFADTQVYAEKLDDLKKVYTASRVGRLTGVDVAQVFSGRVTKGRDAVRIDYDFQKDDKPARDWAPDVGLTKDSELHWLKGREYMKGVIRHTAIWEGGLVSIDARLITPDAQRPNVNFIISFKPGWDGLLVGFGFKTGNMNVIRVDPSAPKKPGWRVVTPCNIAYELAGQPPQGQGKCLVAEEDPQAAIGRAIHYVVKRDSKGVVNGYLGSQNPIYVKDAPKSDEAGQIGIAGFETELAIEHIELVGKLDANWLSDRARAIAEAEAAQFSPPQPKTIGPPTAKVNGG